MQSSDDRYGSTLATAKGRGQWVLGLDGGGTSTRLALASRSGETIGPFEGPGSNPFDEPRWREVLHELLSRSPLAPSALAHAGLGLAGYGETPAVTAAQKEFVRRQLTCPSSLVNDVAAAFHGALAGAAGVLVLAGTGSMAWAADALGNEARAGGLGHDLGDEGSGYWLGLRALRRLGRVLDGREERSPFTDGLSEGLGVSSVETLLAYWKETPRRARIAAVARHVAALADDGMAEALTLCSEAGRELGALAVAAAARLELPAGSTLCLAGGLFASRQVSATTVEAATGLVHREAVGGPLAGALFLAAREADWQPDQAWTARVSGALAL